MHKPITLVLLGNPRGKLRPRFRAFGKGKAKGHAYTDAKTREYEDNLYGVASRYMLDHGMRLLEGPLVVEIDAWMSIPAGFSKKKKAAALACKVLPTVKPDFNNIAGPLDALNGVVWVDDKQIVRGTVTKRYSDTPRLVVKIIEIDSLETESEAL